jgi:mRNA interferase RelE/StbE
VFEITLSKAAARRLAGQMPRNLAERIRTKLLELADDPFAPRNTLEKLVGRPGYRMRIGAWRVIYEIDSEARTIRVLAIEPRGGVYER